MNITEAFEESFRELGIDLDGDLDAIPSGADLTDDEEQAEDGPNTQDPVDGEEQEDTSDDDEDVLDPDATVVDIPEGAVLRLPDGSEVNADKAVLLQKDYTKKTQQLAEERKQLEQERQQFVEGQKEILESYEQFRSWYEERTANPTAWVQEIVAQTQDPTATIARALYELANAGALDPTFVATFGIDTGEVAAKAKSSARDSEVEELRKKIEQREKQEAEQARIREQAQVYQSQWETIKQNHGLQFADAGAERDAKRELLEFAVKSKLQHSLVDAYDLMTVRTGRTAQSPQTAPNPEVTAKKRASRAVTPKSATAGTARTERKPISTREAALQALDEFAAGVR